MSLVKPGRVFINNSRRQRDMFADQFSVNLPVPVQGATRLTLEACYIEYNPEYRNIPPYATNLTMSFSDVGGGSTLFNIVVPNNVDWTTYSVGGQNTWPKNFQQFLNAEASNAGSSAVFTLIEGTSVGLPGVIVWDVAGADVYLYGASNLNNTEQSIMERIGFPFRLSNRSIPQFTQTGNNPCVFELLAGSPTAIASPTTYILGRTSVVYVVCDLDSGGTSDVNLQNILSVIPVTSGIGQGDILIGEDTNSISTTQSPSSDFSSISIILLDDEYAPFELQEVSKVVVEFHVGYDRPASVIIG